MAWIQQQDGAKKGGHCGKKLLKVVCAGEAEFTLRELVTARGNRLQLPLQDGALDASCTLIVLDSSDLNSDVSVPFFCCAESLRAFQFMEQCVRAAA